jgi:hypothetical protein
VLLIADLAILLAIVAAWAVWARDDSRAAVGHDGLHGSVPPTGQRLPDLSSITGVAPRLPTPAALRGRRVLLVGTCFDCRSGDIVGGALRRLAGADLPDDLLVVVAGWGGSVAAWRDKWSLPARIELHGATTRASTMRLAAALRLEPDPDQSSGYAYLYDAHGRWRSSFPAQLMLPDDIGHDVEAIDD